MLKLTGMVVCAMMLSAVFSPSAPAATYYVDFADGDNTADGRSPETAWQHSPGDRNATDNPAEVGLEPGDTVLFKGGVVYHGSISIDVSGGPDNPITFDGNTGGTFGEGRAILDGGRVIEDWKRCESPDDAGGNPLWEDIFYADVDVDISSNFDHGQFVAHRDAPRDRQAPWQRLPLIDGEERLLPISQDPKPSDPFYPDLPGDFLESQHELEVSDESSILTDEENLDAEDEDYYDGKFIGVHGGNNHVYFALVEGFDPDEHRLYLPHFQPSTYRQTRYAFYNNVRLIDTPGEWSIKPLGDGRSRIHLLPERLEDGEPANVGFPVYGTGISVNNGASHLRIGGFLIQRFSGGAGGVVVRRNRPRARDIIIADCEVRFLSGNAGIGLHHSDDVHVENSYIHHCPGWTVGIYVNRVNDYSVRGNRLEKNSGSGIRHYEAKRGLVADNVILDHTGMHATAINLYAGCEDVVLARNVVRRSSSALTTGDVRRIHIINNIFTSGVGIWPHRYNEDIYFLNNYIVPSINISHRNARRLVFKNNILGRFDGYPPHESFTFSHNLYLESRRGLAEGEFIVGDEDEVVRDAEADDFRPVVAGPTLDMGTDVSDLYPREQFPDFDFGVDIAGNPRTYGETIDIGPYERAYERGELDDRAPIATGADAEPEDPIADYEPVPDGEHIIVRGIDFTDEGGGSVHVVDPEDQARYNHVRFWNEEGHWLAYRMEVPQDGEYQLRLRYAADFEAPRRIEVNDEVIVDEITLADTGGWGTFSTVDIDTPLPLEAGGNTIRLISLGGHGCNLDMVELLRDGEELAAVSAGDFDEEGGGEVQVVPAPHHGLFSHWNDRGHWLEWTVDDAEEGLYKVVLRYATLATSPRDLQVNGEVAEGLERFTLDRTGGWRETAEAALPAPIALQDGRNTLRMTSLSGAGLNIDEIRLLPVQQR